VSSTGKATDWEFIRRMIEAPHAEACLSADRIPQEAKRLQARLQRVRQWGGRYGDVQLSEHVSALLARLEAGASLSTLVH